MSAEEVIIQMEDDAAVATLLNDCKDFIRDLQSGIVMVHDGHKHDIMQVFSELVSALGIEIEIEEE